MAPHLLLFFALFFAAAFVWPTWRLWKRDRVNALMLPRDDSAEGYVGRWFRIALVSIFALLAALSLGLPVSSVGPLPWAEGPLVRLLGWALLALSLAWVVLAQAQMGGSWRIGIDALSSPPLVTGGIFGLSRNPIFLGMRLSLLGLFLVLPNAGTLALLVAGEILIQVQVRLEESHLSSAHAWHYAEYRSAVRRWL